MRVFVVQSIPTELPNLCVLGIGEEVFEIIPETVRGGATVALKDPTGKVCQIYVRAMGKLPKQLGDYDYRSYPKRARP